MGFASFCQWLTAHGSSCLELVAVALGIAGVYLSIPESIWNWPIGMVNVALFSVLFARQGLYANAGLQIVYFALCVYGWYQWLHGGKNRAPLVIGRATPRLWAGLAAASVLFYFVLFGAVRAFHGELAPLDVATTTASLAAEWMLARKLLENWVVWVITDAVYVAMFLSDHLYLTAFNYLLYFLLAVYGYVAWKRSLRSPV